MQDTAAASEVCLSEAEIEELRELAHEKRLSRGYVRETPIGPGIFTILENLGIGLIGFPVRSDGNKPAFSAVLMCLDDDGKQLVFIGLNTSDYFDRQVFAVAHELYHFYTKTGSHLSRADQDGDLIEMKADRFAAEFLLPEQALRQIVHREFGVPSLAGIPMKSLLRFIARLQCTWWLPYRSLVKRLREIDAISDQQYGELYEVDERSMNSEYARIGAAVDQEVFTRLNTVTDTISVSPRDIEVVLRNFEDNIIDEDALIDILGLFGKKPEDFGYGSSISNDDMDELERFLDRRDGNGGMP